LKDSENPQLREELVAGASENGIVQKLHTMKQRMEVLFSESFKVEEGLSDVADVAADLEPWEPSIDIWESAGLWLLTADLPGVADEDLHVEIAQRQLTVRGNRKTSPSYETLKAAQIERPAGAFMRTFDLPEDVKEGSLKAEFRRGVLTVAVSKAIGPEVAPQKVQVRVE
jgi:HSP20 family protein